MDVNGREPRLSGKCDNDALTGMEPELGGERRLRRSPFADPPSFQYFLNRYADVEREVIESMGVPWHIWQNIGMPVNTIAFVRPSPYMSPKVD